MGFANPAAHAADAAAAASAAACPATLQHTYLRLQDEKPQSLCQYAGKVVLVVNTASYCGFTGQYKGAGRAVQPLQGQGAGGAGLPVQRFRTGKSSNKEIADFCENTFGVKFPMFAKTAVRADASPCTSSWPSSRARRPSGTSTNTCWAAMAGWWTTIPA